MPATWQLCFDDGHQQRYLPDQPVTLSDGTPGGRRFLLAEVIDLSRPGETERLQAELFQLANEEKKRVRQGLPSRPEPHTSETGGGPFQRRTR